MAQAPVKIRAVGYDDPFATTPPPQLKVRPVGYDDPFATPPAPPPAPTPGFLSDIERGAQGLAATLDLIPYGAERGLRRLFGSGNVDAADQFTKKYTGIPLVGNEGTDALVRDVHTLNAMPANPVMAQAGDAFHNSKTTLGGLLAGGGVIASNPSVIPHMVAEMLPSLPVGGAGGKIASKLAVPLAERVALKLAQPVASKIVQTSAFGAGMNTAMTVANAGGNVAAQEREHPSAPGAIDPTNAERGVAQTAGQIPGALVAGALLPAGSSRFTSPAVQLGVRAVTQSAIQAAGNVASVAGGNAAIGKDTTPEELFSAGAAGLATGPIDLAARGLHGRKAAFDKLVGDFAARGNAGPDIEGVQQFGDTPHAPDGVHAETPSGVVADQHGAPVGFADHKAAARYAAANELGGSHELAVASTPDGGTTIVLRRRVPTATVRPVNGDPFANEPNPTEAHDPSLLPVVEPQPVAVKPGAAGGDGLRPEPATVSPRAPLTPAEAPEPPVLHGNDLRPDPGPLADGEHYVTTPAGNRIRSQFEVVPAASLRAASGDLQNRDRSRDSTDLQVQDIVSNFDPSRLGSSTETDRGSPIVGPDGTVESGNGRMLAINRIQGDPAHAAKADAYRAFIESQGHSTDGITNPVLIRRRTNDFTPEQRRQFVVDSNKDAKLSMTSVERARSDADGLDGDSLALFRGGDVGSAANAPFVKSFNAKLSGGELAAQIDKAGQPSQEGVTRIENALMARAYEHPDVLSKLIEARDNNIRSIGAGMLDNAGPWAQLRAAVKEGHVKPEFDVTPQLVEAARRVSDIRTKGTKVGDELAQSAMFEKADPIVESFMRAFYNPTLTRAASREAISDSIATYARRAAEQTTGAKLFGDDDITPAQILDDILRERVEGGTGDMFAAAADRASNDNPDLDTWHDEVKARRAARQENDNGNTDGKPQRDEGGDRLQSRQAPGEEAPAKEGRGGRGAEIATEGGSSRGDSGAESGGLRTAEGPDLFEGLSDKPDYSVGEAGQHNDAYDPDFLTESFTNRTSIFNSAAETLGIDPDKFTLMPAPRQVALLKDAIKVKFGVEIKVDQGMQERFAIDQMLDAFQNLQGMAHVLDLPNEAISLDGKLTVMLQKKGNFLGMFQPGKNIITLPKRSNSFAHEWGHGLDYYLLEMTNGNGRGLTGSIRQEGDRVSGALPETVREAFVDLLNAMFFDKARAAHRIMELEAKIAASDNDKAKAAHQLAIDKLKAGNSQVRDIRSAFYKGAKTFDGPGGDYWTSPTEMFARAFEAYVSYKVEAAGLTTEFIGKGDAGYLSDADKRFALTFPKGEERANIFAAFEQVFGQISDEKLLGAGKSAEKPGGTTRKVTDYDRTPAVTREKGIINREVTAIKNALLQTRKRAADRADDAKGLMETAADLNAVIFGSMTGNLRLIHSRSKSPSLQKLIDLLTKQDGRGDRTVARTFAEDVHLQSKRSINRLANILKANKLQHLTSEQDVVLRDLLVGARDDGPDNFVKGAAAIRHLLDEEFYVNQRAGIDLGYTRNGYLARVLDLPKVAHDQDGFKDSAAKVYSIVFDNEFGTDAAVLASRTEAVKGKTDTLPAFMKLARFLAKTGHDLPSLDGARKLLKQVKKLETDGADQDEIDKLYPAIVKAIAALMAEVRPAYSSERADAWLAKINLGAGEEHNAASPDSKYTKKRDLPPEADKIMEKYYLSDPVESVINYLNTSARRTSYAKRFGNDGKKRAALFEGMAAEGVSREDQTTVSRILDTATGRVKSNLPRSVEQVASFVTAYTQMALLPRAMLSSLAEPFTAAMVTGNPVDGFRIVGNMLSALIKSPNGRARFELARAMGIVTDHAGDGIMEARYGQTYADATRWDRLTSKMFARTGLTGLTRAQKTSMVGVAHAYLDNLAHTIMSKSRWTSAAAKKNAIALLREFGVRDPEAFAKQMVDANRMPTVDELDTDFGYDYATAQLRLNNMVIQEPGMMDRPEFAANPVARIFYALQGFTYGYYRNIIKRNIILMSEMGKKGAGRGGKSGAAFYGSKLFVAAAIAYAIGVTVSTIREAVLNPKRFQQMQDDGTLWKQMALLGFNRTFSFGAADTVINAAVGLKYRRDLSNVMVGAGPATIAQNTGKLLQPITANSRKTNTAEYSSVQGAYGLLSPFLNFGLAYVPGGALVSTATGVGMAYATSPAARDAVATAVVGPKNGTVVAGKKTKSGPTAWDRMLDSALGKDVKKNKTDAPSPYLH